MRQREQDSNDDYSFGLGSKFLVDSPECVAQAIKTRLRLMAGEWFLDVTEGTDYNSILGYNTRATRDLVLRNRILDTPGVQRISSYSSSIDRTRAMKVTCTVVTIYGTVALTLSV